MPATFDWNDTEEIGIQLADKFPDTDPLSRAARECGDARSVPGGMSDDIS